MTRGFDPDPAQVRLLRLLGVNAETLKRSSKQPTAGKGRWLAGSNGKKDAGIQLGLPNPAALMEQGAQWLCLGRDGSSTWGSPPEGMLHLPTFPPAPALAASTAYPFAAWTQAHSKHSKAHAQSFEGETTSDSRPPMGGKNGIFVERLQKITL